MRHTTQLINREYRNLTLRSWQSSEAWVALVGDDESAELLARDYFWEKVQNSVLVEVDKLLSQGWEPVEPIGSQAIQLRKFQYLDFSINPADVLLWFMTLGIALVMQLILNTPRRYVRYTPVQVRIRLSRLKEQRIASAA
jgi:hypothetical protein